MEDFTIAVYCFVGDYLKIGHPKAGAERKTTDSQIITTALVAAKEFSGSFVKARCYHCQVHSFEFPHKSNFNHHLHWLVPENREQA